MTCFIPFPIYIPVSSGTLRPSCLIDMKPEAKSWTPPARMVPKVIYRNTLGPHMAPPMAPQIGPRPAMFNSWIRKILHVGMTT